MVYSTWKKNSKTRIQEFSNILTISKRSPLKIESNRGKEWYISNFQNFLKIEDIEHYSRFIDKGPSISEVDIRITRTLFKKPVFEKRDANWISELPSPNKQYDNTIHHSIKMTPIKASEKSNEKLVFSKLIDDREIQKPKLNIGQLVRTADIKRVFSEGDSTNCSYILFTITEVTHDTIPSCTINYLTDRYNRNLLLPTKLSLQQNNQVMKELILFQLYNE